MPLDHQPRSSGAQTLWSVLVAGFGAISGLVIAFMFLGGTLKQVDIDTARLNNIEAHGSPQVQGLANQLTSLTAQVRDLNTAASTMSNQQFDIRTTIAAMRIQIDNLLAYKISDDSAGGVMAERVARLEQGQRTLESRLNDLTVAFTKKQDADQALRDARLLQFFNQQNQGVPSGTGATPGKMSPIPK